MNDKVEQIKQVLGELQQDQAALRRLFDCDLNPNQRAASERAIEWFETRITSVKLKLAMAQHEKAEARKAAECLIGADMANHAGDAVAYAFVNLTPQDCTSHASEAEIRRLIRQAELDQRRAEVDLIRANIAEVNARTAEIKKRL